MIAQLNSKYIKIRPGKAVGRLIAYSLFEGRPLTTKGRWINKIVFTNLAILNTLPKYKKVKKPIFIIGVGRSGTTMLGTLLSMHKDVGFLNEPKALWHSIYPNEDVIGSYSDNMGKYFLTANKASSEVIKKANKLYAAFLTASGTTRVVDKYPELIFRIPFVMKIFPDAKFLFLVRDGKETCQSIKKWSNQFTVKQSGAIHDWWGKNHRKWKLLVEQVVKHDNLLAPKYNFILSLKRHEDMALVEWIVSMRQGLQQLKEFPLSIKMIKYENLIEHPIQTLTSLLQFCELNHDQVFFNYAQNIIRSPISHKDFEIPQELQEPFLNTMNNLGYLQ